MVVINASILLFTGSFSLNPTIGEMRMSQNTMILGQPMSRTRAQIKKAEHEVLLLSSFWLWLTTRPSSAVPSALPSAPVASQQSSSGLLPT